jgi:L-aspartate oxidase
MREFATDKIKDCQSQNFDVVIAGTGAAGLYAALNLDKGLKCALINKYGDGESNSMFAQGGIAAVSIEGGGGIGDSLESHIKDTLEAGAGLCNEEAVKVLVREGRENVQKLVELGVPFDRENGKLCITREGAHSYNRILHCGGDATGFYLTKTLFEAVEKESNITIFDRFMLCDVLTDENGFAAGVSIKDFDNNNTIIRAQNIIIATGGIGQIYRNTTNSCCCTGDGIAASLRAGAVLENMEFVQFHPTALVHPDMNMRFFLISEALRGEGAMLLNRKGERFMKDVHPLAELAPRDIVTRAIISEMKKNDLPNVYLDITFKGRAYLQKRFPQIYENCMKKGIDIAVNWIPVIPVQHYFMGGIKTDLYGRTNVKGLYACGECSCTGVHGANRLASNSLLECLVFGRRCAQDINGSVRNKAANPILPERRKTSKSCDFETYRSIIKNLMTKKGSVIRYKKELNEAIDEISVYYEELKEIRLDSVREIEALNMAAVSLEILRAALKRDESIGAHYRAD